MSIASSSTPCDKAFALLEICELISHSLCRAEITACSRVSKAWNASWLPILWHTIDAGTHWRLPAFQNALGDHGDLIRILKCSRYDDIGLLFTLDGPRCSNLLTLSLPKTTLLNQGEHVRLLRQNPRIRDLSLAIHDDPSSHYNDLIDAVGDLPSLHRLTFDANRTLECSTLETILQRCNSSLRELILKDTSFLKHPFGSGTEFASGLLSKPDTIATKKSLEASSEDVDIESKESFGILSLCMQGVACIQDLPLNLVSRFPLLDRFSFSKASEVYFTQDFPARLARRCPNIKHIDISETEDMDDAAIARLIRSFPSLQTLQASDTQFGNTSLATLVDVCRDLTVLEIATTSGNIQGQLLQQLFERCPRLRKVNAWDIHVNVAEMLMEGSRSGSDMAISADGIVPRIGHSSHQGQWACRELESLAISFDYDSTELTEDEQRLYPPSRARRVIYEQLSRLTKLQYLAIAASSLDVDDEDEDEEENGLWIDYSIRSGLASLAPLKSLRTLCLDGIEHGLGVPEIEWMSRHWPRLKVITGLYEDDDEEVIAWLEKNRPDIDIEDA